MGRRLAPVALVAAVVSYRHLAGLLSLYGEDPLTVAIGPLAVDGLMIVSSGALLAMSPHATTGVDLDPAPAASAVADRVDPVDPINPIDRVERVGSPEPSVVRSSAPLEVEPVTSSASSSAALDERAVPAASSRS